MVVDDDPRVLDATARLIEFVAGCEVRKFPNAAEALRAFEEAPDAFPLVVTDLEMPGIDGLELGRRISSLARNVQLVLVTGNPFALDGIDVRRFGFGCVLGKPYSLQALRDALDPAWKTPDTVSVSTATLF